MGKTAGAQPSAPQQPPQAVRLSGTLLELLPDRLEVVPLGFHQLKELPEPPEVYGLLGLRCPGAPTG